MSSISPRGPVLDEYDETSVTDLKADLRERELPTTGTKRDLIARLRKDDAYDDLSFPTPFVPPVLPTRYKPPEAMAAACRAAGLALNAVDSDDEQVASALALAQRILPGSFQSPPAESVEDYVARVRVARSLVVACGIVDGCPSVPLPANERIAGAALVAAVALADAL